MGEHAITVEVLPACGDDCRQLENCRKERALAKSQRVVGRGPGLLGLVRHQRRLGQFGVHVHQDAGQFQAPPKRSGHPPDRIGRPGLGDPGRNLGVL